MQTLSRSDSNLLLSGFCPSCHGTRFILGPRGGLARNILCTACLREYNAGPAGSQIIEYRCPDCRMAEFYNLVSGPLPSLDVEIKPSNSFSSADALFKAVALICIHFQLSESDLTGHCRKWRFVWPRWILIKLLFHHTNYNRRTLATVLNRSSHGTISHALQGFQNEIESNPRAAIEFTDVAAQFQAILKSGQSLKIPCS